jgi:hypothetical protein
MPRTQKLKVYRTPIGFHDAYVAAPSQKAALAAWGSDANLFARGIAEVVTDEELTREPLANPGEVIRRLRGTAAEQIAALPASLPEPKPRKATDDAPQSRRAKPPRTPAERRPKPDRAPIVEARRALDEEQQRYEKARRQLAQRQAALEHERRELEGSHERDVAKLQQTLDRVQAAYDRAIREWGG